MYLIVCYDIEDDKARNRISKSLFDFGLKRVQKSVFEGELDRRKFPKLQQRLHKLINPKAADSIRYYTLCGECRWKTVVQGFNGVQVGDDSVIIV